MLVAIHPPLIEDGGFLAHGVLKISKMGIDAIGKMPRKKRPLVIMYYSLLVIVLYFHNVNMMIDWGKYPKGITAWNFPYISVFDKTEARMIGHKYNVYW